MGRQIFSSSQQSGAPSFDVTLGQHSLKLVRDRTHILQVNVGFLCNLVCRHCHLEAGPHRQEVMTLPTMEAVLAYAARVHFPVIDVTGGAPELIPHLRFFLAGLAEQTEKLIVRTNLVALQSGETLGLMEFFKELRIALVASLPSTNATQADSQRGQRVWAQSVEVLKALNTLGYGHPGTGLELDLAVNPSGAFLPADQVQTEMRYRRDLERNGIVFSNLYTFTNVPLGRFKRWLEQSDNGDRYLQTLVARFNPAAVCGLMCRSMISVSWNGYLYDCDFNLAIGLHYGSTRTHVSEMQGHPAEGQIIPTGEHCYACTAGSGFT